MVHFPRITFKHWNIDKYKSTLESSSQTLETVYETGVTSIKEKLSLLPYLFPKCLQLNYLLLCLTITSLELYLI